VRASARIRPAPTSSSLVVEVPPEPAEETPAVDAVSIRARLQRRLLDELVYPGAPDASEAELRARVESFVADVLEREDLPLNARERQRLVEELVDDTIGAGPIAPLLADPTVTDVLVNGPSQVYVERSGHLERTPVRFRDAGQIVRLIERIAARVGRRVDAAQPMVDLRLPDGSRVNATLPPVSPDGPTLSIRRFGSRRMRRDDLVRMGTVSQSLAAFLDAAVRGRQTVLISGGTGAGKSTLLGVLSESISEHERIITIEDTLELILDQEHVVRLEARPANVENQGRIGARELVTNALRMRPDRIIVGEVRGGEALDMLQAMNTGHDGSLCTVHANAPRDALARLETMVLMSGVDLPSRAIREQIAAAIALIVHIRRGEDGVRRVETVSELVGMEGPTILLQDLFVFRRQGLERGRVVGTHTATGVLPRCAPLLRQRGLAVDARWFAPDARLDA
jgi:pilus assembly protein CpaF